MIYKKNRKNNPSFKSGWFKFISYTDYKGIVRGGQINTNLRTLDYKKLAKTIVSEIAPEKPIIEKIQRFLGITNKGSWKKANIYCLAGADGTEGYAFANAIIGEIGFEKAKQYVFPIYVSDVSEEIINTYGKAGIIRFYDYEIKELKNIREFLVEREVIERGRRVYELKPEFRECFEFETADLQEKISKSPGLQEGEFNVFAIRNCFFDGFEKYERDSILKELTEKYPERTMVVLGEYDLLKFKQSDSKNFFPLAVSLRSIGNDCYMSCRKERDTLKEMLRNNGLNPDMFS